MHRQRWAALVLVGALVVVGCGGDDAESTAGERGWLDDTGTGWTGGDEGGDGAAAGAAEALASAGEGDDVSAGEPVAGEQLPGVTAGSVDDNERWDDYLRYRDAYVASGQPAEELDVAGRRVVTVLDGDGAPVLGALLTASVGGEVVDAARTTADGRALLLLPVRGGVDQQQRSAPGGDDVEVDIRLGDASSTVVLDGEQLEQTVVLEDAPQPEAVQLDLLFLIDATGSMGDEIERLKAHMTSVAEQVAALPTRPDVRFAMTIYRDEGDLFVTRTFDFTDDVATFTAALAEVVADGGGDEPEALNEGLGEALSAPAWRGPEAVKLVVLLADAPPQLGRAPAYVDSLRAARQAGVKILPIASSDTSPQAEFVFRQLAQATLGRFSFLTYGADGAPTGTSTPMSVDEFEVLSLDALVVRLVTDELADRG